MRTVYLLIAILLLTTIVKAQDKLWDYDPGITNQAVGIASSYHVVNPLDSSSAVFIIESNQIHEILCDQKFNFIKKMLFEQKEKGYTHLIGHSLEGHIIHLLFAGRKATELYSVSFDPILNKSYGTWVPVVRPENEDAEVFLSAIQHNNNLYLLFINKITSKLRLYHISSPSVVAAQTFDPESPKLYDYYIKNKHPLESINLLELGGRNLKTPLTAIHADEFNNLDVTHARNKVYSYQNHIIITLDDDEVRTALIEIDPEKNTSIVKYFSHPDGSAFESRKTSTGSFYYRGKLLQLRVAKEHLVFTVRDVETDSLICCHEIFTTDPVLQFVNTPFYEELNHWNKKGQDSPKKFLNKLHGLDPALTAFQFGDTLQITIGGYLEQKANNGPLTMGQNGMMQGVGYSPGNEDLLFAIGLFDPLTFKHLSGTVEPHVFIKMAELNHLKRDVTSGEIKFHAGTTYYYGFYNCIKQKYFLFKYDR